MVKNPPVNARDVFFTLQYCIGCRRRLREADLILGREAPLKEGMATHSNILAWESPWTEEHDGLQFTGLQRVRHD